MIIHMIPRRAAANAAHSTIFVADGERLAINGVWTDFGPLEDGGIAEHDSLESMDVSLIRKAERIDGALHVHVIAEIGPEFQTLWPALDDPCWTVEAPAKGLIAIPATPVEKDEDNA